MKDKEFWRARLTTITEEAGVYLMRNKEGVVIYVGKAINLRRRLRQYFVDTRQREERIKEMVSLVEDFEVIVCQDEIEALLLENNLIKKYSPKYNIRLKEGGGYLYLKIPKAQVIKGDGNKAGLFPRPVYTRSNSDEKAVYFGPYPGAGELREIIREVRGVFPFRTCSDRQFARGKVCLDYHLKRCAGPCEGKIDEVGYEQILKQLTRFMRGESAEVRRELTVKMNLASKEWRFEEAAKIRDQIKSIEQMMTRRKVGRNKGERDYVGVVTEQGRSMGCILTWREGTPINANIIPLVGEQVEGGLRAFLLQYYLAQTSWPNEIWVRGLAGEEKAIEKAIGTKAGRPVVIREVNGGEEKNLIELTHKTAREALEQNRIKTGFQSDTMTKALMQLQSFLSLSALPRRIECYDISNTSGTNSVGSMVVFEEGRPKKEDYRIFNIKTVEGPNDFASLQEVMRRRLAHLMVKEGEGIIDPEGANGGKERGKKNESLTQKPDLIIIDGGKGQLSAVMEIVRKEGFEGQIEFVGLAKQQEELFLVGDKEGRILPAASAEYFLVQRIRDEAHRLAIQHHRGRRARSMVHSKLDEIAGIGPKRRAALLKKFGSLPEIRRATVDELCGVKGISPELAKKIKEWELG